MATWRAFHFLAERQLEAGGVHRFDGVIRSSLDPLDDGFYDEIKRFIAEAMTPPRNPADVSLMSLSLLAERQID